MTVRSLPVPLSQDNLGLLSDEIDPPRYDRSGRKTPLVHLGVGGFHRAHQAVYTDALLRRGDTNWSICGVGLQPADAAMREALTRQDFLYTSVGREGEREEARVIGSITDYVYGPDDPGVMVARLADPVTQIVSMTVTEKGYHVIGTDRGLDMDDPAIRADLDNPDRPGTMPGLLVAALKKRRDEGRRPFTILSCDNIPENGAVLRAALISYSGELDPGLSSWITDNVVCPCTMVDRITPVTTDENREYLADRWGVHDLWPVFSELFTQWVIEDRFPGGRPAWDRVGASFVSDVKPFELMKIRLLNGTHSALSYLALLLGHVGVPEAMADPEIVMFVRAYMRQVEATLSPIAGVDYAEYRESLVRRFANPAVADQLLRLAQDGSSKFPVSILEPLGVCLAGARPTSLMSLAVAGWLQYIQSSSAGEQPPLDDPLADELVARARASHGDPTAFLAESRIFPPDLADSPVFREELREHTAGLAGGVRAYLQQVLAR